MRVNSVKYLYFFKYFVFWMNKNQVLIDLKRSYVEKEIIRDVFEENNNFLALNGCFSLCVLISLTHIIIWSTFSRSRTSLPIKISNNPQSQISKSMCMWDVCVSICRPIRHNQRLRILWKKNIEFLNVPWNWIQTNFWLMTLLTLHKSKYLFLFKAGQLIR